MATRNPTRRNFLQSSAALPAFALVLGSAPTSLWANQKELISKDAYKEIIKYRIQTDRNTKTIDKIDHVINAFVEDHYDPLDDHIRSVESGADGKDELLSLLSFGSKFLPTKYKRAGRAIQILNFGSQKITSRKKTGNSIEPRWQESVNKSVDLLYKIIETAPNDEMREKYIDVLNKHLSKDIGKVNASVEEVYSQFPDFTDHKALHELVKKDELRGSISKKDVQDILAEFGRLRQGLSELNEARLADEERRMNEEEFQAKILQIDNITAIGNLAIAVIRRGDKQFASQAAVALNAYSQGTKILAAMNKHGDSLSQIAGAANLTLLSLNVVAALGSLGQKTPDQLIMESLQELKETILKTTRQILKGIDMLSSQIEQTLVMISIVYDKVQQNANSLQIISTDLDDVRLRLLASDERLSSEIRTLEERKLARLITRANGEKQTVPPRLWSRDSKDFRRQVTDLRSFAIEFSRDKLSINNSSRGVKLENVAIELSNLTPIRNLSYIIEMIEFHFTDGASLLPSIEFDPVTLYESALALMELIKDWPEYQADINTDILDAIVADIQVLLSVSPSFKYADSGGRTNLMYSSMQRKAVELFRLYLQGLEDSIGDLVFERLKLTNRVSGKKGRYSTLQSSIGRFKFIDFVAQHELKGTIPVKAIFANGHWKGSHDLALSAAELNDRIPLDIKAAYALGLINLRSRYTNEFSDNFRQIETVAYSPFFEDPNKEYLLFEGSGVRPSNSASSGGVVISIAPTYSSAYYNQSAQELFTSIITSKRSFDIGTAKYNPDTEEITNLRNEVRPLLEDIFDSLREPAQRQFEAFGHARHLINRGPGLTPERIKGRDIISQFESTVQVFLMSLFIGENSAISRNNELSTKAEMLFLSLKSSVGAIPAVTSQELLTQFEYEIEDFEQNMARASVDENYLNRDYTPFVDFEELLPKLNELQNGLKTGKPVTSFDYTIRQAHQSGLVQN